MACKITAFKEALLAFENEGRKTGLRNNENETSFMKMSSTQAKNIFKSFSK